MSHNKTRPARLDPNGDAQSMTRIVAHTFSGKLNMSHNVVDYELRDTDPHQPKARPASSRKLPVGHMRVSLGVLGIRTVKPVAGEPGHHMWKERFSDLWHDCTREEDNMVAAHLGVK